ncbi:MAG: ribonuclease P [Candidatus Aenigmatarchaeota archaeon]|nr:MAG: ribonuclease P [Candidatus Aenigmarchaeota archaeon]
MKRSPAKEKKIGKERIERLFKLAAEDFHEHPERADRKVELARKIAMRYNIRLPRDLKRKYCKKCYKYLEPNVNCIVKKRPGYTTVKCLLCGNVSKYPSGG